MLDISLVSNQSAAKPAEDIFEGENRIYDIVVNGFGTLDTSNYNLWVIYELPSGAVAVSDKVPIGAGNDDKIVSMRDGVLMGEGVLKIQAVISTADNIFNLAEQYASGSCEYPIYKSKVYEFYISDSIDIVEEIMSSGSGISQDAKDYLEFVVNQIIAEGLQFDDELSDSSINAVQNAVVTEALARKVDKNNPFPLGYISLGRYNGTPLNPVSAGNKSIAVGHNTEASGDNAISVGHLTKANAGNSQAFGNGTSAGSLNQMVIGKHNEPDSNGNYVFIIGNGNDSDNKRNAFTVDWDGNLWFAGNAKVGGSSYSNGSELATKTYADNVAGAAANRTFTQGVSNDISSDAASATKVPSVKAIKDYSDKSFLPKRYQVDYEKQSAISGTTYSDVVLHDSNENGIQAYDYTSRSPLAPDVLINAASRGESAKFIVGNDEYPLVSSPFRDLDYGTITAYWFTYNAELLNPGGGFQWKKIDDSKEIVVINIAIDSKTVEIWSSKSYNTVNWSIVRDLTYASKDDLYLMISNAPAADSSSTEKVPSVKAFKDYVDALVISLSIAISNNVSTDASSTTKVPSVKAIKDYADTGLSGKIDRTDIITGRVIDYASSTTKTPCVKSIKTYVDDAITSAIGAAIGGSY